MRTSLRVGAAAVLAGFLALPAVSVAQTPPPIPPCAGPAQPGYPAAGKPPDVAVWRDDDLADWRSPHCMGFEDIRADAVVATAGRFHEAGGVEAIAARIARISAMTSIRYFSIRDDRWKQLFVQAHALGETGDTPRADFSAGDLQTGRALRFLQEESSLLSPVTYRLRVRERTADRLVYEVVNESAMRVLFLRAGEPGDFRQLYFIERESGDTWLYYGLVEARFRTGPFSLSSWSFRYRSHSYFRFVAGQSNELDLRQAP